MSLPRFVSPPIGQRPIPRRVVVVHWAFAGLLLVAAGLKAESVWDSPATQFTLNSVLKNAVIAVECCLAAWLLSGLAPAFARRGAIFLLLTFIGIATWRLANNADDCGCFGKVKVRPAWTLALDATALLCIAWFGRVTVQDYQCVVSHSTIRSRWWRILAAILISTAIPPVAMAAGHAWFSEPGGSPVIVLEPESWIGREFPLFNDLEPTMPEMAHGRWGLILIDHDCQTCKQYLERSSLLRRKSDRDHGINVVVIDISSSARMMSVGAPVLRLRGSAGYIFEGPFEVFLTNGVVETVHRQ